MEFLNNLPTWVSGVIIISGAFFGLIGTVLGLANFYISLNERKVSLQVNPFIAFNFGDAFINAHTYAPDRLKPYLEQGLRPIPGIEVINRSSFPVTIDEVGFCIKTPRAGPRSAFLRPLVTPNQTLPLTLEPRRSLCAYAEIEHLLNIKEGMETAYVTTSCNSCRTNKSKMFLQNFQCILEYYKSATT